MYYILKSSRDRNIYYCGNVQINKAEHFSEQAYQNNKGVCWDDGWRFIRINDDGSKTIMTERR